MSAASDGSGISRRTAVLGLAGLGVGIASTAALPLATAPARAAAAVAPSATSVANAYAFLQARMDQRATGSVLRVPQSYTGGPEGAAGFVSSFAYDDAIVILAWIARGTTSDLQHATVLGDALLHAQAHDPIGDGRTRASYQPDPFITADGTPYIGSPAANTGNQAWVGMALARLGRATGQSRFLAGAVRLGEWIRTTTLDTTRAPYGYTGGRDGSDVPYAFKSTEHAIDVLAFFNMLATLTGDAAWTSRAATASSFVAAMRDASDGHLWTGTDVDGTTVNRSPVPGDVQNWAYLATGSSAYSPAVTWVITQLAATDGGFAGSSYSSADRSKVWFEGTAHLALAVRARGATGDPARYADLMATLERAQATAPRADGRGIVAASSDGLVTGFGDVYNASLHTGATAWYLLAALGWNPFRL
jgi:hypothetical protein